MLFGTLGKLSSQVCRVWNLIKKKILPNLCECGNVNWRRKARSNFVLVIKCAYFLKQRTKPILGFPDLRLSVE